MLTMKRACLLAAILSVAALAAAAFPAAASTATAGSETRYFAIYTDGQKIGYAANTRAVAAGRVTTTVKMSLTISRLGQSITVKQVETNIETPDGRPLGFESVQDMGTMAMTVKGRITPAGKVRVTSTGAGQSQVRTMDWPKGAVLAEGLRLTGIKHGLKKGTSYTVRTYVPSMLRALTSHVTVGGRKQVDLLGRVVTLTKITTGSDSPFGPVSSTSYVDGDLQPQKTVTPAMGMTIEMIACDRAFATSPNDVVDFIDKTLLQSPVPLVGLATARSATYHFRPKPGKKLVGMISTDSQTVVSDGAGGLIVTVAPARPRAGATLPYRGKDQAALRALEPTRYVQSDAPAVIALARQAVGNEKDAARAAGKIEAFVNKYITKKSLSVGYATAAEVAASRQGDCTEHAVLTAAMCRAVGIPARVVVGYVYVPKLGDRRHVFGGHAWVEARIGDKWIGLDATRPRAATEPGAAGPNSTAWAGGATAGHIAQAVGDGGPGDFFTLLATMGNFTISKVTINK